MYMYIHIYQLSGAPEATSEEQKFPGGTCPQTPLGAMYSTHSVINDWFPPNKKSCMKPCHCSFSDDYCHGDSRASLGSCVCTYMYYTCTCMHVWRCMSEVCVHIYMYILICSVCTTCMYMSVHVYLQCTCTTCIYLHVYLQCMYYMYVHVYIL